MTFSLNIFSKSNKTLLFALLGLNAAALTAQKKDDASRTYRLKSDISYLASDALEGRVTGSPGEKLSADYIARGFEEAGLKPGKNGWYQTFEIIKLRIATQKCILNFTMDTMVVTRLKLHEDYYPISQSGNNDSASGELLDCGYGIVTHDSTGRDDFSAAGDAKGKIVMIRLGFPGDADNPHGPMAAFADLGTKIREARAHGAAGIIFLPGSSAAEVPPAELNRSTLPLSMPVFYLKKNIEPPRGLSAVLKSSIAAPTATGHNVVAYSKKFRKRRNTIVVCAHHDHLGYNEYGGSRYTGPQAIHNGADDNASGVAAMMELARSLKPGRNNLLFIAFSGEEMGLIGSKHFVKNIPVSLSKINYVINIDMLGRVDSQSRTLVINGTGTSPAWKSTLTGLKTDTNRIRVTTTESGLGPSDHASFYLENIPVLHFFSGQHEDYHKPSDDEALINYEGMCRGIEVIEQVVKTNSGKKKIAFTKTKDVTPGRSNFKVTMGVMPDYAFSGNGMKLDGVTEGKPAMKAGLQRGDIITKIGNRSIGSVQDYMQALGSFSKGEKAEVTYIRGGETKTTTVEF